jgi:hypothetical protein
MHAYRYSEPMNSDPAVRRRQGERGRPALIAAPRDAYAGLERIKHLEEQLARASVDSGDRRRLAAAIRIEAVAYRKSLDTDQAAAMHGRQPRLATESRSPMLTAIPGKRAPARPGTTGRRNRVANA